MIKISILLIILASQAAVFSQQNDDDNPVSIFNAAQTAHEKGDFETALKLYEKALEIFPDFPEAEYQRGNVLISLSRPLDAELAFRRALDLRENWTLPMTSLGVLFLQNRRYEEADEILTKVVEIGELNLLALTALTELKIKTNATPEVLKQLLAKHQYLTTKPNSTASLWASRAALERTLGDKKAAIASLDRAIGIDHSDRIALAEHAELSLADGDHKSALIDAEKLKQLSPNSANVDFLLARVYASMGEFERSIQILDSVKDPSNEITAFRDKVISGTSRNVDELETRVKIDKNDAAVLGRLCMLLRVDSPERALEYCRRAAESEPNNLEHAIGFGAALVQAKRFPEAITLFRRLLEVSPENFTVHTNLATALFQSSRFGEAKAEYKWIIKKQPDLAIAYYLLAISHDKLEEYVDAAANYQHFLRVADQAKNQLEMDKVNLRLPGLQKMIKQGKGKKNE